LTCESLVLTRKVENWHLGGLWKLWCPARKCHRDTWVWCCGIKGLQKWAFLCGTRHVGKVRLGLCRGAHIMGGRSTWQL